MGIFQQPLPRSSTNKPLSASLTAFASQPNLSPMLSRQKWQQELGDGVYLSICTCASDCLCGSCTRQTYRNLSVAMVTVSQYTQRSNHRFGNSCLGAMAFNGVYMYLVPYHSIFQFEIGYWLKGCMLMSVLSL